MIIHQPQNQFLPRGHHPKHLTFRAFYHLCRGETIAGEPRSKLGTVEADVGWTATRWEEWLDLMDEGCEGLVVSSNMGKSCINGMYQSCIMGKSCTHLWLRKWAWGTHVSMGRVGTSHHIYWDCLGDQWSAWPHRYDIRLQDISWK